MIKYRIHFHLVFGELIKWDFHQHSVVVYLSHNTSRVSKWNYKRETPGFGLFVPQNALQQYAMSSRKQQKTLLVVFLYSFPHEKTIWLKLFFMTIISQPFKLFKVTCDFSWDGNLLLYYIYYYNTRQEWYGDVVLASRFPFISNSLSSPFFCPAEVMIEGMKQSFQLIWV